MKFMRLSNQIINLAFVAWAERHDNGAVTLHLGLPRATTVREPGTTDGEASHPAAQAATDHVVIKFTGPDAAQVWRELKLG